MPGQSVWEKANVWAETVATAPCFGATTTLGLWAGQVTPYCSLALNSLPEGDTARRKYLDKFSGYLAFVQPDSTQKLSGKSKQNTEKQHLVFH